MGISISLELIDEAEVREWLGRIKNREAPRSRRRLVRRVLRGALGRTIENNPVDTARARASWVESLEQLGGFAPAGWEGPQPESDAINEGRNRGEVAEIEQTELTDLRATSGVDYINYLEFGTRKMSPFQMVRRSLASLRSSIPRQPFFRAAVDDMGRVV